MTAPANQPPPSSGDYPDTLAESQQSGTAWTCRCSCPNPGTWDTCQECQQPS